MTDPVAVLPKLPKNTPLWAVGLVTLIVSFAVSVSGIYLVTRAEVQQWISESFKLDGKKAGFQQDTVQSILAITSSNTQQIGTLTEMLKATQDQNFKLQDRMSNVERDLLEARINLTDCLKHKSTK